MPRLTFSAALFALLAVSPAFAGDAVSPRDLAARLSADAATRPLVLDVRSADEYAAGHVPGAVLIPHDQVAARIGELDRSRPVVVYCRSGRRSGIAEGILQQAGFRVSQLDGSYPAWEAAGLPRDCANGPCAAPAGDAK